MIKIEEKKAKYFDDCGDCGEVIDRSDMYEIEVGSYTMRLCSSCFKELKKVINKIDL